MNCAGSVALIKALEIVGESDAPDYQKNGTAAHEAAAACLEAGMDAWEVIGQKFGQDVEVDGEMAVAIQVYLDYVSEISKNATVKMVERRISHPAHPLFYGTVDYGQLSTPDGREFDELCIQHQVTADYGDLLDVTDYKHGEGIMVDVWDNPQIMYYAYGLLRQHPTATLVRLTICQPRGFHVEGPIRVWVTTAKYINDWAAEELIPAMHRTEMDHTLDAGPWCRFCPAKLVCPLLTSLFRAACVSDPKEVIQLSDDSLGRSYGYTQAVKFYLKAMEDETFRRLNSGRSVPGTKLVLKRANRVWNPDALALMPAMFGGEHLTEPEVKSPAELEKLSPGAKKFVKEHAYTPQSGLTVALSSDTRCAVTVQSSAEVFKGAAEAITQEN